MSKFGTYTIVIAIVLMLLPDILAVFDVTGVMDEPIYPVITMILGGLGVLLHVINLIKEKSVSMNSLVLLLCVVLIISGVSLSSLSIEYTEYLTLAGLLLVALWIAIPQRKKNKKADQD